MQQSQPELKSIRAAINATLNRGSIAALITVIKSDQLNVGVKMFVSESGETAGQIDDAEVARAVAAVTPEFLRSRAEARVSRVDELAPGLKHFSESLLLFERIETEPHLIVAGAGHVGAALARLAALVGYRVTLIDDRGEFVARELFSSASERNVELIAAHDWGESISKAMGGGRAVSIAIVTRGHKQDEDCLRAALAANPDYIGMIGSKRRTNIVLGKLSEEGFAGQQLRKVRAPVGLDIGAVAPEEVALAILAEVVAERRSRPGGSLSAWRRG